MSKHSPPPDVTVIGAGPVGSYAALKLAEKGITVQVYEEHSQIGYPAHCAGHISIRSLRAKQLYPLPNNIIENNFSAANFYSPQGTKFSLNLSCPITTVLNRAKFDLYLAERAKIVGAEFALNSYVQSLILNKGTIQGIKIQSKDGTQSKISSKVVLDAEGISSRLLRQTGLPPLSPSSLVYAVEAEMKNVQNLEPNAVEVYFGKGYAPGFYAWIIPLPDGSAKVGLATNKGDPRSYLKRLMTKHPVALKQIGNAKITSVGYHAISLGGPISRAYSNGFLAMGDCASQVKPTTGGGVIFGLTAAEEAANVVSQALANNDFSAENLQAYQNRCNDLFNFDIRIMLKLRSFLDSLSDERIDEMLRVCDRLGVGSALANVTEIDFQGKMLLNVASKPSMLAALGYFALLYLTANP